MLDPSSVGFTKWVALGADRAVWERDRSKSSAPCGIAAAVTPRRMLRRRSRASGRVRCG